MEGLLYGGYFTDEMDMDCRVWVLYIYIKKKKNSGFFTVGIRAPGLDSEDL